MTSSADDAAAKAWRMRNSDGNRGWDEVGNLVATQPPPSFDLTDEDLPDMQERLPASVDTSTGVADTDHLGRAVVHEHVWDTGLVDPDA
jgi:hypothetical protein